MKLFPDDDRKGRILCHALTADFLYYGTDVRLSPPSLQSDHNQVFFLESRFLCRLLNV